MLLFVLQNTEQIRGVQMNERLRGEKCGVFGIWSRSVNVAKTAFYGLYSLQHRGQESSGICSTDGRDLYLYKDMGLVSQIFDEEVISERLSGHSAIGHTRYSTTGESVHENVQPILLEDKLGKKVALAHNGNIPIHSVLRQEMEGSGFRFYSSSDTEVLMRYLLSGTDEQDWVLRFRALMNKIEVAYSLVVLADDCMIAARDPYGMRPLCIGKIEGGFVVASESCALQTIEAEYVRDVNPGEMIIFNDNGMESHQVVYNKERRSCSFESIYFSRPDSILDGKNAYQIRLELGRQLAKESFTDADVVIGVPDSGIPHAIGYSRQSTIPYEEGFIKNRYIGRTFITPDKRLRNIEAYLKYNTISSVIKDKKVIVVDDSIVRGTTAPKIVSLLFSAGAKEVHIKVASPMIKNPCHFGVDMASYDELIAFNHTIDEIRNMSGATSLSYLSTEGLMKVLNKEQGFCTACFTGEYPVDI